MVCLLFMMMMWCWVRPNLGGVESGFDCVVMGRVSFSLMFMMVDDG